MLKIRIRPARISDAVQLADLSGQLGYPSSAEDIRRRLRAILRDPEHAVWVAEIDGATIAGWTHVFVKRLLESDRDVEIGGLVVNERFRGRGIGKTLVKRAEQWAKSKRLKSVYVRSNVIRESAHAFYQGLGYKIIKTQYAFRKSLV
ncbi:MAG TPA: GNAT family N-acetyltransferase [Terriglobia bacterium]|nr:GNAT family N-acetyltransferase [Terriglobia bacterium]